MSDPTPSTEIYLITPPAFSPAAFVDDLAAALDGGPVACLQLRMKDVDDDAVCQGGGFLPGRRSRR